MQTGSTTHEKPDRRAPEHAGGGEAAEVEKRGASGALGVGGEEGGEGGVNAHPHYTITAAFPPTKLPAFVNSMTFDLFGRAPRAFPCVGGYERRYVRMPPAASRAPTPAACLSSMKEFLGGASERISGRSCLLSRQDCLDCFIGHGSK